MKKKKTTSKLTKNNVKSAVSKANDFTKFLIDNKEIFVVGAGLIVAVIAYRKIKNTFSSVGEGVKDAFAPIETDVIDVEVTPNTTNLTITENKAKTLAKELLEAFNYKSFGLINGTDEDKIEAVFNQINTGDDYKLVYNSFNKRPWVAHGTPDNWIDKKFFAEDKDLNHWLREELNSFFDKRVYNIVKERLATANMNL